ncbi:hypothetical protein ACFLZ8_00005, partial [Planctomycetota bacterium]
MVRKALLVIISTTLLLLMVQKVQAQRGGGRGRFGRGGSNRTTEFVKNYDKDGNGWLDTEERNSARRPSGNQTPVTYNPMLTPSDVTWYSD